MTCEDVRRALIERPSGPQPDLQEHLQTCAECRALMEEIRMGDEAVGGWVDAFAKADTFDAAWKQATAAPVAPRSLRPWALAAAALLVAGASFGAGWISRTVDLVPVGTSEEHPVSQQTTEAVAVVGEEADSAAVEMAPLPAIIAHPAPSAVAQASPVPEPEPEPEPAPTPIASEPMPPTTTVSTALEATTGVEPRPVVDDTCMDLRDLEPAAMLGKLTPGQVTCLEARFPTEPVTGRDQISRVLLANAYSAGDMAEWERLVRRHLDEISQADPDLDYKYALFLSKKGGRSEEVIRWANVAISHDKVWSGKTYEARVYSLHKLRAAAAQDLWRIAAADQEAAPSPDQEKAVAAAKARTRTFAKDWFDFAVTNHKDYAFAAALCVAAGGTCGT